jgi:hypothetical protein
VKLIFREKLDLVVEWSSFNCFSIPPKYRPNSGDHDGIAAAVRAEGNFQS